MAIKIKINKKKVRKNLDIEAPIKEEIPSNTPKDNVGDKIDYSGINIESLEWPAKEHRINMLGYGANGLILFAFILGFCGMLYSATTKNVTAEDINHPNISGETWYPEDKIDLSESANIHDNLDNEVALGDDVKLLYEGVLRPSPDIIFYTAIYKVKDKKWVCVITTTVGENVGSKIKVSDRTPTGCEESCYDVVDRQLLSCQVVTGIGTLSERSNNTYMARARICTQDVVARLIAYYF